MTTEVPLVAERLCTCIVDINTESDIKVIGHEAWKYTLRFIQLSTTMCFSFYVGLWVTCTTYNNHNRSRTVDGWRNLNKTFSRAIPTMWIAGQVEKICEKKLGKISRSIVLKEMRYRSHKQTGMATTLSTHTSELSDVQLYLVWLYPLSLQCKLTHC